MELILPVIAGAVLAGFVQGLSGFGFADSLVHLPVLAGRWFAGP